ncbi:ATP-binding protein [Allorhodopirellula solitaria]|uniref:AAA+ ATPase domain-containing protein n=1 Tax=Allorhodopirellula solitaria TaxID=2527987 RepID=A0A5C5XP32_9BACT|nr:ATP-binding protein [Allorhodopirellula solitaria]TWT64680.1 hypothetical protein CA85_38130 [Allorhodopirellula solitaria]
MCSSPSSLTSRSNPFASRFVRPGALAFRGVDGGAGAEQSSDEPQHNFAERLIARLREARCGVIVGNHGTGKSTLLRELAGPLDREMSGGVWVQLTQSHGYRETLNNVRTLGRLQRSVARGGVFVIDGAEQVPRFLRSWIAHRCRRGGQFALVTSHHELAGFETLYHTELSPELINELLGELLAPEKNDIDPALHTQLRNHLQTRDLREVSNLRDLWDELYDVAQAYSNY